MVFNPVTTSGSCIVLEALSFVPRRNAWRSYPADRAMRPTPKGEVEGSKSSDSGNRLLWLGYAGLRTATITLEAVSRLSVLCVASVPGVHRGSAQTRHVV